MHSLQLVLLGFNEECPEHDGIGGGSTAGEIIIEVSSNF